MRLDEDFALDMAQRGTCWQSYVVAGMDDKSGIGGKPHAEVKPWVSTIAAAAGSATLEVVLVEDEKLLLWHHEPQNERDSPYHLEELLHFLARSLLPEVAGCTNHPMDDCGVYLPEIVVAYPALHFH